MNRFLTSRVELFPSMFYCIHSLTLTRSDQPFSSYDRGNFSSPFNFHFFVKTLKKAYLSTKKIKKSKIKFFGLFISQSNKKYKKSDKKKILVSIFCININNQTMRPYFWIVTLKNSSANEKIFCPKIFRKLFFIDIFIPKIIFSYYSDYL
jgi:hypothetical protein